MSACRSRAGSQVSCGQCSLVGESEIGVSRGSRLSWREFFGQAVMWIFLVMDSSQGRWANVAAKNLALK